MPSYALKWASHRLQVNQCWPRPILALSLSFALGIAIHRFLAPPPLRFELLLPLVILYFLHFPGLFNKPLARLAALPIFLFLGIGMLASEIAVERLVFPSSLARYIGQPQTLFLAEVIAPVEHFPDKIKLPLKLHCAYQEHQTVPIDGSAVLTVKDCTQTWRQGDFLFARLSLEPFHNFTNPGSYDYERAQAELGFYSRAFARDDRLLIKLPQQQALPGNHPTVDFSIARGVDQFRQNALAWLQSQVPGETGALYAALLLGYRTQVSKLWQEHLSRAGVIHLLAISGLHLGLVSMGVFWAFRRMLHFFPGILQKSSDQHYALWMALICGLLYAMLSGLALPTWRASIMLTLFFAAIFCSRPTDTPSTLACAALLMLFNSPLSLWSPSFQMSFAAIIGIFAFYSRLNSVRTWSSATLRKLLPSIPRLVQAPVHGWMGKLRRAAPLGIFVDAFWISVAANMLVLPLVVYHFRGFSLAGFAANTLLVPIVGFIVLPLGLISLAVYPFSPWLATLPMMVGRMGLDLCQQIILLLSARSWAFSWVGEISPFWLIAWYTLLTFLFAPWSLPRKILATACAALCLVLLALVPGDFAVHSAVPWQRTSSTHLQVVFIDVGQGSCTLLRFPEGQTMLVDGGGFYDDSYDVGRNIVAPLLWKLGISKLDCVVLSHAHPDHRNGLKFVLDHFEVGSYWETGVENPCHESKALHAIAVKRGIPVRQIEAIYGDHVLGPCRLQVLHPDPHYLKSIWDGADLNNTSLVLRIEYGDTHLILPGDIDESVETRIFVQAKMSRKTLLLAPHHGSRRSNGQQLLQRLQPEAVVFSCGYHNHFRLPDDSILKRYQQHSIPVYRTDLQGAIWAVSNGKSWTITATKPVRRDPFAPIITAGEVEREPF